MKPTGTKPLIGITMGDAAGIGPELILRVFETPVLFAQCRPVVLGSFAAMELYREQLGSCARLRRISRLAEARFDNTVLDVLDLGLIDTGALRIGQVDPMPGRAAVEYTLEAGRMALRNEIDAMVSAPLNKESMRSAGYEYEGQTQILGELTGARRFGMILLLGELRVMMLTTHMALRRACEMVTKERVLDMIELAHETLETLGIRRPRIAVAGLNPHSGEGGLFGTEEIEGSIPAIRAANERGIRAAGPVPADVVFLQARNGEFDLVLAMYHDQANMAAKLLGFGEVVTLLAGLPILRTSVGHGTAFDIAGKGIARPDNFRLAVEAAAKAVRLQKGETADGTHR